MFLPKLYPSSFSLSFICRLVFSSRCLPRFQGETVDRWTIKVLCWLCNSDNFTEQSFCFVGLDLKQTKKKVPTVCVSCFLVFLLCHAFVPSFKYSKITMYFNPLLLSLWSSQVCSQKDGPFQFPSVQACTLGPSPHGRCHWRTHHLLQVSINFLGKLKVKINYGLCGGKPHFFFWFRCVTKPKGKGSSVL